MNELPDNGKTENSAVALSLNPIKKFIDNLLKPPAEKNSAQISPMPEPTPSSTPTTGETSGASSALPSITASNPTPSPAAIPKIIQPINTNNSNNFSYLSDINFLKSEINDLKARISNISDRFRYVQTIPMFPSTNTIGIGNITLNPKILESETATVSGTTTTAGLVVTGNAQIDGTTNLNSVTYTWPSSDGSALNRYLKTDGSGALSWAQSVTSNSLDFDELVNSMTLDASLTINRGASNYFVGIGSAPQTVFEVQGTASASYFLTGNTLQVGGYATESYSRFGTSTTSNADFDSSNDLLVSGSFFVAGASSQFSNNMEIGGTASISGALTTYSTNTFSGTGSSSFAGSLNVTKGIHGLADITATGKFIGYSTASNSFAGSLDITKGLRVTGNITNDVLSASRLISTNGNKVLTSTDIVSWIAGTTNQITVTDDSDGTVTLSTPQDIHTGATVQFAKLGLGTVPVTVLEVQGTASASYGLFGALQVAGFSSQSYSRFGTGTTSNGDFDSADDLFVTGSFFVQGASSQFSNNMEIGGTASISGALTTYSTNTFSGTGSSSFAGSLSVAKGFLAGANNALVVHGSATANTLNIVGGNVGIGTTGPTQKLDVTGYVQASSGFLPGTASDLRLSRATGSTLLIDSFGTGGTTVRLGYSSTVYSSFGMTDTTAGNLTLSTTGGSAGHILLSPLGNVGIGTTGPATKFEVQGTASASYFLTGNTLQVGGFSSTSYSRFGTNTTSEAHYITGADDVLISGDLEVDGSVSFAGPASISNTLYVSTLGKTGNVGIGTTGPLYKLDVQANASTWAAAIFNDGNNVNRQGLAITIGADDASGTNTAIEFYDGDSTSQGAITFSSGTVTYGAFTANHDVKVPEKYNASGYPYGTLICTKKTYLTDSERGIKYDTEACNTPYAPNVLGAYAGKYEQEENKHQVYVLGDGHILVNNEGGDIKVGDLVTTSSVEGIGMKATKFGLTIGVAQEDITFSSPNETKLVAVQYGLRYRPMEAVANLNNKSGDVLNVTFIFNSIINEFKNAFDIVIEKGILRVAKGIFNRIETNELCVGEVCVTEAQFMEVFGRNTPTPEVQPQTTVTPTPTSEPTPHPMPEATDTPEPTPESTPESTPELTTPDVDTTSGVTEPTPEPSPISTPSESPTPEPTPEITPEPSLSPSPSPTPVLTQEESVQE